MSNIPQENHVRDQERDAAQALRGSRMTTGGARGTVVNRTHRVVREQALHMQEHRQRTRSLWVPLTIFSILMIAICYAIWGMLDGYNLAPNGVPDASDQLVLLLLWSLPVTAAVLGLVWFRRTRGRAGDSEAQL
jgi:hypothetical protein